GLTFGLFALALGVLAAQLLLEAQALGFADLLLGEGVASLALALAALGDVEPHKSNDNGEQADAAEPQPPRDFLPLARLPFGVSVQLIFHRRGRSVGVEERRRQPAILTRLAIHIGIPVDRLQPFAGVDADTVDDREKRKLAGKHPCRIAHGPELI